MTEIDKYTTAVACRKAYDSKRGRVNIAILMELEDNDIPRLLEIIRVQDFSLRKIKEHAEDDSEEFGYAERALLKVEELAAAGSSARWGGPEPQEIN